MATTRPPQNEDPPKCSCGCGAAVNWMPGKGWARFIKGHSARGRPGSRLGVTLSVETRRRMSEAAVRRYRGNRRRDRDPIGPGVYSTKEYHEARAALVEGRCCTRCGTAENIHAHHRIPGDDSTLIPLCGSCHVIEHRGEAKNGREPPAHETPPLCACGCYQPVSWKRHRGWAKFRKGHGSSKVPGRVRMQDPPLCKCGCGEETRYRYGYGWGEYKRGHRQRVEGGYRTK